MFVFVVKLCFLIENFDEFVVFCNMDPPYVCFCRKVLFFDSKF